MHQTWQVEALASYIIQQFLGHLQKIAILLKQWLRNKASGGFSSRLSNLNDLCCNSTLRNRHDGAIDLSWQHKKELNRSPWTCKPLKKILTPKVLRKSLKPKFYKSLFVLSSVTVQCIHHLNKDPITPVYLHINNLMDIPPAMNVWIIWRMRAHNTLRANALPETNITHENEWLTNEFLFGMACFQRLCMAML